MRKFLTFISTLAIILTMTSPFTYMVAFAKTTGTAGAPPTTTKAVGTSTTTRHHARATLKPRSKAKYSRTPAGSVTVSRGKTTLATKRITGATTSTIPKVVKEKKSSEKAKGTPRLKKRKPFDLGIDPKPYLAIITLLFIAVKTGYAKTSLSPLRYSSLL